LTRYRSTKKLITGSK